MKNTSKFLAVMLAITGLFCCAVAVGIGAGFNAVRESTDKKIIAVINRKKRIAKNVWRRKRNEKSSFASAVISYLQ